MEKIAIIGAGFSGLATANLLKNEFKESEITLFEATDRIGGLIHTTIDNGYVMEWGPEAFMTQKIAVKHFVEQTDLLDKLVPATRQVKRQYVVHKGKIKRVPSGLFSGLTTPLIPFKSKFGVLKEPFVKPYRDGEESFSSFINRRLSKGLDPLIDAFVSGVYGGDHTKLSVNYAFPTFKNAELMYGSIVKGFIKGPRAQKKMLKKQGLPVPKKEKSKLAYLSTFPGGLTEAINHLAEGLTIKTSTPIQAIVKNGGTGYTIKTPNGSFEADKVIFALPPNHYLKIDTSSLQSSVDLFKPMEEAVVNVVTLVYADSQFKKETEGYGFLAPSKEKTFSLGILFVSDIFPEHAQEGKKMLRCFIGGIRHPDRAQLPDEDLIAGAKEDVKNLLQVEGEPEKTFVARNRGLPQINVGHKAIVDYKNAIEKENQGIFITGVGWTGVATTHLAQEAFAIVNKCKANN